MEEKYLKIYRTGCYRRLIDWQLKKELLFVEAILNPESYRTKFVRNRNSLIKELVEKTLNCEIDHYELYNNSNKYFPRVKYPNSHVLQDIVLYRAGLEKAKNIPLSINEIGDWWEHCSASFFMGYVSDKTDLGTLIASADWDRYIKDTRDMEGNNDVLLKTVKDTYASAQNDNELITKIYHYNDGSYLELPNAVEALVWMIKMQQRWDLFVKVLGELKYYPYQGCLTHWLMTVEDCAAVIQELKGCQHEQVLHHLLRERVFWLLREQELHLKTNTESQVLGIWSKEATKLYKQWLDEKESFLVSFAKRWINVFGVEEMGDWISEKSRQAIRKIGEYKDYDIAVLKVFDNSLQPKLDFKGIRLSEKGLPTLFYYALAAKDKKIGNKEAMEIFSAIVDQIYKTCYCPEWQFDEKGIKLARAVYGLMPPDKEDGLIILKTRHKPQEGYKVDRDNAFNTAFGESFLLSILLLQVETSGDKTRFNKLIDLLFTYSDNGSLMHEDQFFVPYYIAELIATQVLEAEKDEFEHKLIERNSSLSFVLRILTANNGQFSEKNKTDLKRRVDLEWEWEKKLMIQRKNEMYKVLDKYIASC